MAREFSRSFYRSAAWKKVREYVFNRDYGICVKCGSPGEEVHHTVWLTPDNINDPNITLNSDKLITLCRECHQRIHSKNKVVADGLMFDAEGNLIKK